MPDGAFGLWCVKMKCPSTFRLAKYMFDYATFFFISYEQLFFCFAKVKTLALVHTRSADNNAYGRTIKQTTNASIPPSSSCTLKGAQADDDHIRTKKYISDRVCVHTSDIFIYYVDACARLKCVCGFF